MTLLAPWRSPLSRALHRNRAQPFCRFLQLATVRPDGTPANRSVVFRGFLPEQNQLMIVSDRRAEKIAHIQCNPNVEACWYFTKTREQFRISGRMSIITADSTSPSLMHARQQRWQSLSDQARLQFAWPHPKAERTTALADFSPPPPDPQQPLPTFCLLLLDPCCVDYLSLRGDPQERVLYKKVSQEKTSEKISQEEKLEPSGFGECPKDQQADRQKTRQEERSEEWIARRVNP